MIHDNLLFHNAADLETRDGIPGKILPRYPRSVRDSLNERGRMMAMESTGVEIRFVTTSPNVRIYLSTLDADAHVWVQRGNYSLGRFPVAAGKMTPVHVVTPERFAGVKPGSLNDGMFSPDVWRFAFNRNAGVFHALDTFGHSVRAPRADELPKKRYLAYGSSITHSGLTGYPAHAARRLKVDLLNKGLSGSCHCEKEAADFLIEKCEFDFATLELGVNMRGHYEPPEFRKRAEYLIHKMVQKHPAKPIFVITVFPNFETFWEERTLHGTHDAAYTEILRDIVAKAKHPTLEIIEGAEVLTEFSGLGQDLIHPSDEFGHVHMGENLARIMAARLAKMGV